VKEVTKDYTKEKDCGRYAERIFNQCGGDSINANIVFGNKSYHSLHVWVEKDGRHYDGNNPTGVSSPEQLDYFKRDTSLKVNYISFSSIERYIDYFKNVDFHDFNSFQEYKEILPDTI
jgi:hypothetical protein